MRHGMWYHILLNNLESSLATQVLLLAQEVNMLWKRSKILSWEGYLHRENFILFCEGYLHREYCKTSFICSLIATTKNLIWLVVFLFFCSWWLAEEYLFAECCISSKNLWLVVFPFQFCLYVAKLYKYHQHKVTSHWQQPGASHLCKVDTRVDLK